MSINTKSLKERIREFTMLSSLGQVKDRKQIFKFLIFNLVKFAIIFAIFIESLHDIFA